MHSVSFARGKWSPKTRTLYEQGWRDFGDWCELTSTPSLPAEPAAVAAYITERARRLSTSTISLRLHAIYAAHKMQRDKAKTAKERERFAIDSKTPEIADAWSDIKRAKGTAGVPKDALATADIRKVVDKVPAHRLLDRAVLLLGFYSAMRRSEIAALDREDIDINPAEMIITIRRSKTDKSGKGAVIAVARTNSSYCAVTALEAWLAHSEISSGAIFRSIWGNRMLPERVAQIVKLWGKRAGFNPRGLAGHSLRRGCITSMHEAGVNFKDGMALSRHKTFQIYSNYVQDKLASENPAVKRLAQLL